MSSEDRDLMVNESDEESSGAWLVKPLIGGTFLLGVGLVVGGFAFGDVDGGGGGGGRGQMHAARAAACNMSSCDGIEGQGKGECQAQATLKCCNQEGTPTAICCDRIVAEYGFGIMTMTPGCNDGCDLSKCSGIQGQGLGECLGETRMDCCILKGEDHMTCCSQNVAHEFYPQVTQCRDCDNSKCDDIVGQGKGECLAEASLKCCEADGTPKPQCCDQIAVNYGVGIMTMTSGCSDGCDLSTCNNLQGQGLGECLANVRVACCLAKGGIHMSCCADNVAGNMYSQVPQCRACDYSSCSDLDGLSKGQCQASRTMDCFAADASTA